MAFAYAATDRGAEPDLLLVPQHKGQKSKAESRQLPLLSAEIKPHSTVSLSNAFLLTSIYLFQLVFLGKQQLCQTSLAEPFTAP